MLQFDLQFYEELTVAWVRTVKFISGAFFWPTGQLVFRMCSSLAEVIDIYTKLNKLINYSIKNQGIVHHMLKYTPSRATLSFSV